MVLKETASTGRDATIDAVRAVCLLVVVVLHSLMVGVQTMPDGSLKTSVALTGESWFPAVTWMLQIMPLFFIAGGFASLAQWRRIRARGGSAAEYIAGRVWRLAAPAAVMVALVGSVLLAAVGLGADRTLIAEASLRIGEPLWFLAVYIGVTSLVPVMTWLHERAPVLTIAGLAAALVAVDLAHTQGGLPVGYVTLALVWPLMQQLGFAMRDGLCAAWPRRWYVVGILSALALMLVLVGAGWSPDMLDNLNPPTTAIALLGLAQFFLLRLLRPALDAFTGQQRIAALVRRAGSVAMSIYLWHMPIILALVAALWALGVPMPEPHSGLWWATRMPWLIAVGVAVVPFAVGIARGESRLLPAVRSRVPRVPGQPGRGIGAAVVGAVAGIAGTAVALLVGIGAPFPLLCSVVLLGGGSFLAASSTPRSADGNRTGPGRAYRQEGESAHPVVSLHGSTVPSAPESPTVKGVG